MMDLQALVRALPSAPFFFLRHGETDWNKRGLAQWQTDVSLNSNGRDQAAWARPLLVGQGLTRVIASPLKRAFETAEIVNTELQLTLGRHPGLMEQSFGPYEGKPWNPKWYDEDPGEGAEPKTAFADRCVGTLNEILERYGKPAAPLLLVSHGGVFHSLAQSLCALPNARSPNAVPFRFDPPGEHSSHWRLTPVDPVKIES